MKKVLLLFFVIISMIFVTSCGNQNNSNNNPEDPWDNLGGGGIADETPEIPDINIDEDAPTLDDVENPDDNVIDDTVDFETVYTIDLNNLNINTDKYTYTDDILSINAAGEYLISGTLNGAIEVSGDPDKVRIILSGATISTLDSQSCAALVFKKHSGERILTIATGTKSYLSDSIGDNSADGDNAIIQAKKSSLIINGAGQLHLTSKGEETTAIKVKNDLSIYETRIFVDVNDNGIKAGEVLSISNAYIDIQCGNDAIKTDVEASTQEEADKYTANQFAGYIYIYKSNIKIVSGDDGISANSYLKISNSVSETIDITTNNGAPNTITEYSSDNANGKAIRVSGITLVDEDGNETDQLSKCEDNYYLLIEGGTFIINSNDDAITSKGNLVITGGVFEISTGDDGIHAEYNTVIDAAEIYINKCYEGIEGASVWHRAAITEITSVDDGINAANADLTNWSYSIYIECGKLTINAQGDGIDSNGTVEIAAGDVIVYGPTNGGNASLDADRGIKVTGGILVALGAAGMIETPSTNSTQCCVSYTLTSSTKDSIKIFNAKNELLLEIESPKTYQSIIVSMPDFEKGETYTFEVGGLKTSVTLSTTSVLTKMGSSQGGMPPGGPGGKPGRPR